MQPQAAVETRAHYEDYPFIEGGKPRIEWWQDYLRPFLPDEEVEGRLIGDIGSSVGEIARGIANRGGRMVCLDLTRAALQRNREINPEARLFHGSAIDLPFADQTFDHTISIGVLMITPDCRRGFKEVARVTAPGGRVVLFIYNSRSYLNVAYKLFAPVRKVVPLSAVPRTVVRMMQPFARSHLGIELEEPQLRRLLGDKLWTPHATFHSLSELRRWGEEEGLTILKSELFYHSYAHVIAFRKSGELRPEPAEAVSLRCLQCEHQPISEGDGGYTCPECGESYPLREGIYDCLR